ncbi:MAG: LAGLIDADG family homing endonuclease [Candidatus Paceibacterota bacterium]
MYNRYMAEPLITNRIKFNKKGVQGKFILHSKEVLNLTWSVFAQKLKVNPRTLAEWAGEKFTMSEKAAKMISKLSRLKIPKDNIIINWDDHLKKISKSGGRAVIAKYGKVSTNEEYRKERWEKWWKNIGQYKENPKGFQSLIKIKIPPKDNLLAEFVGIMLGDGGVNQFYTTVTLSSVEKQYIIFVSKIINKLFNVVPMVYKHKDAKAVRIVINRKQMVNFCQEIGLVKGNKIKQQIDIPNWIKENQDFSKACVRGLIDTDGCFYNNSYIVNGKKYFYFKVAFISASKPLISSVAEILGDLGIKVVINKHYRDIRIVESQYILKYIQEVGSNNQKHLKKIKKWKKAKNMLK